MEGVILVKGDMCRFEMVQDGKAVKKSTGFLTNSPQIARELDRTCKRDHEHTRLIGGNRCRKAQVYPTPLCKAICRGAAREKEFRAQGLFAIGVIDVNGENALMEKVWEGEHEEEMPCCPEEVEP